MPGPGEYVTDPGESDSGRNGNGSGMVPDFLGRKAMIPVRTGLIPDVLE